MIPENSIANTFPQLAQEWASDLNTNIDPLSLLPGSDKKVWWRCSQGHEWETRVNVRTLLRKSCPVCANRGLFKSPTRSQKHQPPHHRKHPPIQPQRPPEPRMKNPPSLDVSDNPLHHRP